MLFVSKLRLIVAIHQVLLARRLYSFLSTRVTPLFACVFRFFFFLISKFWPQEEWGKGRFELMISIS
jgi:hypothetical protein